MNSRTPFHKSGKSRSSEVQPDGVDLGLSIQSSNLFGHVDFQQYKQMLMQERRGNSFIGSDSQSNNGKTDRPNTATFKRMNSSLSQSETGSTKSLNIPHKNVNIFQPPIATGLRGKTSTVHGRSGSANSNTNNNNNSSSSSIPTFTAKQKSYGGGESGSAAVPIPVVRRTAEEKRSNPDRLSLDRRGLTVCPILESEENLRLLNYQHNFIKEIQNLEYLRRLIFLDLYDNQISSMATGLSHLTSLRVLMLGKNRIEKMEGLENLMRLDVLDLHGNQISVIENVQHLHELRVLNLASNCLRRVENLASMDSLTELNLRRNQIYQLTELDELPTLQRLFLSFNDLTSWPQMECLSKAFNCTELSLDGNPIAKFPYYRPLMINNIGHLQQLDGRRISDEERRQSNTQSKRMPGLAQLGNEMHSGDVSSPPTSLSGEQTVSLPVNKAAIVKTAQCSAQRMDEAAQLKKVKSALEILHHLGISSKLQVTGRMSCKSTPECSDPRMFLLQSQIKERDRAKSLLERRRLAIKNVQKQWEASQGVLGSPPIVQQSMWNTIHIGGAFNKSQNNNKVVTSFYGHRDLVASHVGNVPSQLEEANFDASASSSGVSCSTERALYSEDTSRSSRSNSRHSSARATTVSSGNSPLNSNNNNNNTNTGRSSRQENAAEPTTHGSSTPQGDGGSDAVEEEENVENVQILSLQWISASGDAAGEDNSQCHVAEIVDGKLKLYGTRSLEYLEKQAGLQAAGAVHTIAFCYIDFELIAPNMHKIRARFPSLQTIHLESVNLTNYLQINALSGLKKLNTLHISSHGNPFLHFQLWRHYIVFRLSHMKLTKINDIEITARETVESERLFAALTHMTTVQSTLGQLLVLIADTSRRHQEHQHQAMQNVESDSSSTQTYFADVVGKLGLTHEIQATIAQKNEIYKKKMDATVTLVDSIFQQSLQSKSHRYQLCRRWPRIIHCFVNQMLDEMLEDRDAYTKAALDSILT